MMSALADQELRRARWRRVRERYHLLDAEDQRFASGGLAQRLDRLAARLLLLPDDPELSAAPTDEGLLERMQEAAKEWGAARRIGSLWGHGKSATAEGPCLFGYGESSAGPWNQYLCLRAGGGLDAGLGTAVVWSRDDATVFHLGTLVARIWSALELHAKLSAASRGQPGEVTLALVDVRDSALSGLADGWRSPFIGFREEAPRCREANVLLRIELPALPRQEDAQDLAYELGALIDNVWGSVHRRFLIGSGEHTGEFDWRGAV